MNHKKFNIIKSMNYQKLYDEAKNNRKLTFNKFDKFIKTEIEKYALARTKHVDPDRFYGKEHELEQYSGVKMFVNIDELK